MNVAWLPAAVSAFTCRFDPALLAPLQQAWAGLAPLLSGQPELLAGGFYRNQPLNADFQLVSYDTDPLFWISPRHAQPFALFEAFADRLQGAGLQPQLRQLLDCRKKVALYGGFFVAGDRLEEAIWHHDYRPGAQGYTLITPLTKLAPDHGGLWYQTPSGQRLRYAYTLGEAIVLGADFLHSTEPYGPSAELRVLLSLTLGSDKMQHWPLLKPNIAEQASFFRLPCGHVAGQCRCETRRWPF